MEIYTSYFGNISFLEKNNIVPVSIARFPPKWYTGLKFYDFAPTPEILNLKGMHPEYKQRYISEILDNLNIEDELAKLIMMVINDGHTINNLKIALCCFETPGKFCHRHILADYINNKIGNKLHIEEYTPKIEIQNNNLF